MFYFWPRCIIGKRLIHHNGGKMTIKNKFKDQNYIMRCTMPSELFTVKSIKREYRELAKLWHPDVSNIKEALYIMSKINALYNEGCVLIAQNKFYEKERIIYRGRKPSEDDPEVGSRRSKRSDTPDTSSASTSKSETKFEFDQEDEDTLKRAESHEAIKRSTRKRSIELVTLSGKCIRFRYIKRVMIELGYMYLSEEHVLLEITKLKRKIFMDSVALIQNSGEAYFKIALPEIIDTFDTQSHGYIVLKKERGVEPITILESVLGYLKPLGSRKICEGIFYDLMALKYMGLTSTALDKDLWFIDVNTGKLHNYGLYFYLHEFNSKLVRAPKGVSESLKQLSPRDNETLIIDLVKNTIVNLNNANGLKIDDFHHWLTNMQHDSIECSLAESQVFNRSIVSVTTHGFDLDRYYTNLSYQ